MALRKAKTYPVGAGYEVLLPCCVCLLDLLLACHAFEHLSLPDLVRVRTRKGVTAYRTIKLAGTPRTSLRIHMPYDGTARLEQTRLKACCTAGGMTQTDIVHFAVVSACPSQISATCCR